jgi:hypothetical protein
MKAITLHQPWASLVACGRKTVETRSWQVHYRGPLAIHAALRSVAAPAFDLDAELPRQAVIATCDLVDVVPIVMDIWGDHEMDAVGATEVAVWYRRAGSNGVAMMPDHPEYGDYTPGRFAWLFDNIKPIGPIATRGWQALWDWDNGAA